MDNQELQQFAAVATPILHSSFSPSPPPMLAATSSASTAAIDSQVPLYSFLNVMTVMIKGASIIPFPNTQQVIFLKLSNTNFLC
jgi:hypothetical protein